MLFQSKWRNSRYVVRRSIKTRDEWGEPEIKWGLVAKFEGPQRLFDSELAQERYEWTDAERLRVEKHLLSHKDFGHGLYLAGGQTVPEKMQKFVKDQSVLAAQRMKCLYTSYNKSDMEIVQCSNDASVGRDFCDAHDPEKSKVVKGMLTTKE